MKRVLTFDGDSDKDKRRFLRLREGFLAGSEQGRRSIDADAKNAFLELDAVLGKINVDSSVSNVKAAIAQFLARLRS